jgi:hypothetical protein
MASWLDSLAHAWVFTYPKLRDEELLWWLRNELGENQAEPFLPVSRSLLIALGTPPERISGVLASTSFVGFVKGAHQHPSGVRASDSSEQAFGALRADRLGLRADATPQEIARVAERKVLAILMGRAATLLPERSHDEVARTVARLVAAPDALPFYRLVQKVYSGLGAIAERKTPGSSSFKKTFRSAMMDVVHLGGGAYCDIFTCDAVMDGVIEGWRSSRGLLPQRSAGTFQTPQSFVDAVRFDFDALANRALNLTGAGAPAG